MVIVYSRLERGILPQVFGLPGPQYSLNLRCIRMGVRSLLGEAMVSTGIGRYNSEREG